jgi:hypothetical protein
MKRREFITLLGGAAPGAVVRFFISGAPRSRRQ